MGYYSTVKKSEVLILAATQKNLEHIMLSEGSQSKKTM